MKKWLCILLALTLCLLTACTESKKPIVSIDREVLEEFDVRSLAEFHKMQQMQVCSDEDAFNDYLSEINSSGVSSREDLEKFVEIIETTPYVSWLDGEFVWIRYCHEITIDTDEEVKIITLSREGANGEWTRTEYLLHYQSAEEGVKDQMSKYKAGKNHTFTEYQTPIQSADKLLTVYGYAHRPDSSGRGDEITYFADLGGKVARIVYYTKQMASINAQEIISSLQVMPFKDYIADK